MASIIEKYASEDVTLLQGPVIADGKTTFAESILKAHTEMEFVRLQINYADWEDPNVQSRKCYETTGKYGKPIIVMEQGGLPADPPPDAASILKNAAPDRSCAQWALRFAASLDGVFMVLSGMSSAEQMRDKLTFMTDFQPLSDREMRLVAQVREALGKLPVIPCTACSYCTKVCPANIGIPGTFEALNLLNLYHNFKLASGKGWWNTEGHHKEHANRCLHCGKCESACPRHIPIRKHLAEAAEKFKLNG